MSKLPTKTGMKSWQCEDYGVVVWRGLELIQIEVRAESHAHPDGWSIVVTTPVREGVGIPAQVNRDMHIARKAVRAAVTAMKLNSGQKKEKP